MIGTQEIRPATVQDLDAVVEVHLRSFRGFFLTFLGRNFLRELYDAILADPSGIILVSAGSQGLTGFVAGSTQPSGLYRRLLQQRMGRFALAALPAVLRKPHIALRLVRALRAPENATAVPGTGTLLSIAVFPEAQGKGIGQQLVLAFLATSQKRGLAAVDLTTDAQNNEAANRFYRSLGFSLTRSFTTPEGRAMNEYRIEIQVIEGT